MKTILALTTLILINVTAHATPVPFSMKCGPMKAVQQGTIDIPQLSDLKPKPVKTGLIIDVVAGICDYWAGCTENPQEFQYNHYLVAAKNSCSTLESPQAVSVVVNGDTFTNNGWSVSGVIFCDSKPKLNNPFGHYDYRRFGTRAALVLKSDLAKKPASVFKNFSRDVTLTNSFRETITATITADAKGKFSVDHLEIGGDTCNVIMGAPPAAPQVN